MGLAFPLADGIRLRLNSSLDNLKDFLSGNLTVDINPDENVPTAVLMASARYSNQQLVKASSLCLTNLYNTTEIVVQVCAALFTSAVSRRVIVISLGAR